MSCFNWLNRKNLDYVYILRTYQPVWLFKLYFCDMSTQCWTAAILDTASKVLPLVVAVSGRVGSDTPLICQQSGMRGVIVEETVTTEFICSLVCGDK